MKTTIFSSLLIVSMVIGFFILSNCAEASPVPKNNQQIAAEQKYNKIHSELIRHPPNKYLLYNCKELSTYLGMFQDSIPVINKYLKYYKNEVARLTSGAIVNRAELAFAQEWLDGWTDMLNWTIRDIKKIKAAMIEKGCSF